MSTIRIENNKIPEHYKEYSEYSGDYTFECWVNVEKIKELFEKYNIETQIVLQKSNIEIDVENDFLFDLVVLLKKYEFIK
jgi:hypothetical protein